MSTIFIGYGHFLVVWPEPQESCVSGMDTKL